VVLGQQLRGLPLVGRVGVGMQEDDCRRGDALRRQPGCCGKHGILVEGNAHAAVHRHPLRYLQPQVARHQRSRLHDPDVAELILALASPARALLVVPA
jgi:hypothetical protein